MKPSERQLEALLAELARWLGERELPYSAEVVREAIERLRKQAEPPTPAAVAIVADPGLGKDTWHAFEDDADIPAWRDSLPAGTWARVVRGMGWEFHRKGDAK